MTQGITLETNIRVNVSESVLLPSWNIHNTRISVYYEAYHREYDFTLWEDPLPYDANQDFVVFSIYEVHPPVDWYENVQFIT